jgi:hypothetical protein
VTQSKNKAIKAATLPKLVEHLTLQLDTDMVGVILMSYPTFATTDELLTLSFMRYNMPRPKSQKDSTRFVNERLNPCRFRVLNFLKTWVESYWSDFSTIKSVREVCDAYSSNNSQLRAIN